MSSIVWDMLIVGSPVGGTVWRIRRCGLAERGVPLAVNFDNLETDHFESLSLFPACGSRCKLSAALAAIPDTSP